MTFVPESTIEAVADELNQTEDAYENAVAEMQQQQPVLLAYLFSEELGAFSNREREFMLYLALVLYRSIVREAGPRPPVGEQQLSDAEEHNWELLQDVSAKRFHERLDVFFDDSPQEDLLAFIEDALSDAEEEEDELVTKEGREAMFVVLKSFVDCLTRPGGS